MERTLQAAILGEIFDKHMVSHRSGCLWAWDAAPARLGSALGYEASTTGTLSYGDTRYSFISTF